ncbi:hypothetical protein U9M48_039822 [Paspalum notatum var. saurae]|uniref:Uncharacterized protein n=1 Tax=Paspalum notatum var. saurae TaxID=547442 RepID=A0AAQ3UKB4_PASNO
MENASTDLWRLVPGQVAPREEFGEESSHRMPWNIPAPPSINREAPPHFTLHLTILWPIRYTSQVKMFVKFELNISSSTEGRQIGLRHFKVEEELSLKYFGLLKILAIRSEAVYQLESLARLLDVHNVLHIYQLKKCLKVPEEQILHDELSVQGDLSYAEHTTQIRHKVAEELQETRPKTAPNSPFLPSISLLSSLVAPNPLGRLFTFLLMRE